MKLTAKLLAVAALSGVLMLGTATEADEVKPAPVAPIRPCSEEDSTNCFWDAAQQGNGQGYSFWVDVWGNVTYLDSKLNKAR